MSHYSYTHNILFYSHVYIVFSSFPSSFNINIIIILPCNISIIIFSSFNISLIIFSILSSSDSYFLSSLSILSLLCSSNFLFSILTTPSILIHHTILTYFTRTSCLHNIPSFCFHYFLS